MLKRDHRLAVCRLCAAAVSSLPRSGHQADNGDMETDTELIMNRGEHDIHQLLHDIISAATVSTVQPPDFPAVGTIHTVHRSRGPCEIH